MKPFYLTLLFFLLAVPAMAQVDDDDWLMDDGWVDQSDFDKFKKESSKAFNDFRDSANARFAKAIEGKWQPFAVSAPIERPHDPEPKVAPVAPKPEPGGEAPQDTASPLPVSVTVPVPTPRNEPERKLPPAKPPKNTQSLSLDYYGNVETLEVPLPAEIGKCRLISNSEKDVAALWKTLSNINFQSAINRMIARQNRCHYNDWGMYEMCLRLSKRLFADNPDAQVVATVFLMNQMEYDAKICRTDKGLASMLCIATNVYAVPFIMLDKKHYYIMMPDGGHRNLEGTIHTYQVDFEGASLPIDMQISKAPSFSEKKAMHGYSRTVNGHTVNIDVNQHIVDFYSHYPQVDMTLYANAAVDSSLGRQLEQSFAPLVKGKNEHDAATALLDFIQHGFDYATDDEQFGYEKPFFLAENFYYPKNDCEDRAMLLSWLVRKLLGLDVVLLHYPNHLSMAVNFSSYESGTYVLVDGKRYVECDPTYIGASIGMTQSAYRQMNAEVIRLGKVK